jgi:hypothetical protein
MDEELLRGTNNNEMFRVLYNVNQKVPCVVYCYVQSGDTLDRLHAWGHFRGHC